MPIDLLWLRIWMVVICSAGVDIMIWYYSLFPAYYYHIIWKDWCIIVFNVFIWITYLYALHGKIWVYQKNKDKEKIGYNTRGKYIEMDAEVIDPPCQVNLSQLECLEANPSLEVDMQGSGTKRDQVSKKRAIARASWILFLSIGLLSFDLDRFLFLKRREPSLCLDSDMMCSLHWTTFFLNAIKFVSVIFEIPVTYRQGPLDREELRRKKISNAP